MASFQGCQKHPHTQRDWLVWSETLPKEQSRTLSGCNTRHLLPSSPDLINEHHTLSIFLYVHSPQMLSENAPWCALQAAHSIGIASCAHTTTSTTTGGSFLTLGVYTVFISKVRWLELPVWGKGAAVYSLLIFMIPSVCTHNTLLHVESKQT